MKSMIDTLKTSVLAFVNDEEGAALVEYGLLVSLIAAVVVANVTALGVAIDTIFSGITTDLGG
jgi:pilus assembly protein Flp/PilA